MTPYRLTSVNIGVVDSTFWLVRSWPTKKGTERACLPWNHEGIDLSHMERFDSFGGYSAVTNLMSLHDHIYAQTFRDDIKLPWTVPLIMFKLVL